jgi:hypothetical protein
MTPPTGSSPDLAPAPPGSDMALAVVGAPCTNNNECGTGFCGHSWGLLSVPGGYCTADCSGANKNICPAGSTCEHLANVGDFCLSTCPPDPCRSGYKCCDLGKGGGSKSCAPGAFCDS